ncbi:MAG: protoporphyrinogen oxidase, partial [Ilumatobacteraceae bacterium]
MTIERRVAVIGAGITGLAAAHAALEDGALVTVLEAQPNVGGVIRTTPFAGHPAIDEGADAFLARVPWAVDLARAVSLGDSLTSPAVGRAAVWWNGLHDIPEGLLLGLPTDLVGLARSGLLSRRGKLRAATEVLRRRSDTTADSIGRYVRSRFGNEVHERLVDPLIGSIYAADTDDFSLVTIPQLAELASRSRSVLLAGRHRPAAPGGPVFYAPA